MERHNTQAQRFIEHQRKAMKGARFNDLELHRVLQIGLSQKKSVGQERKTMALAYFNNSIAKMALCKILRGRLQADVEVANYLQYTIEGLYYNARPYTPQIPEAGENFKNSVINGTSSLLKSIGALLKTQLPGTQILFPDPYLDLRAVDVVALGGGKAIAYQVKTGTAAEEGIFTNKTDLKGARHHDTFAYTAKRVQQLRANPDILNQYKIHNLEFGGLIVANPDLTTGSNMLVNNLKTANVEFGALVYGNYPETFYTPNMPQNAVGNIFTG